MARTLSVDPLKDLPREWLETDGHGGFAMGTEFGFRTRRYHALLCAALHPPLGRVVLVNGLEMWVEGSRGLDLLSTQIYGPAVVNPRGYLAISHFKVDPWPTWTYQLGDGALLTQELFIPHGQSSVALRWSLPDQYPGRKLAVRPLLSARDFHHLHQFNENFRFDSHVSGETVQWRPYAEMPAIRALTNGTFQTAPQWYYHFLYVEEQRRGMDCTEDLASPGFFEFDLGSEEAVLIFTAGENSLRATRLRAVDHFAQMREQEQERRAAFASPLDRAADSYFVERGRGLSLIAGFPWFSDWGRDTFIAMRGLCLARGRLSEARQLLLAWSALVSEGMLPNRFLDSDEPPEFNSVDASLWFIIAAGEFLQQTANPEAAARAKLTSDDRAAIEQAIEEILLGYQTGTRFGIHLADDGLIAAGEPGVQLTWMDAKVGNWVVTPRIGKPVEIQALWLNALPFSPHFESRWRDRFRQGLQSFQQKFWNAQAGYLYDVIDVDHVPGSVSAEFRPNQLFAVGGLPRMLLPQDAARQVIEAAERLLWTPWGPRSLSPNHPAYVGTYAGPLLARDGAYHQGTVWPWLAGAFIEGWFRIQGATPEARRAAREKFLNPLMARTDLLGLGHLPEIADGDSPHLPRGCPFQAWSLGEILRLDRHVLAQNNS